MRNIETGQYQYFIYIGTVFCSDHTSSHLNVSNLEKIETELEQETPRPERSAV